MPDESMRDQVVIISGASRGLGKEIALQFGRMGARVVVNYRRREQDAAAVVDEIHRGSGAAIAVRADVGNAADVRELVAGTIRQWGRVDVLVNNAGMLKDGLCLRMSERDWDDVLLTNLTGPFLCIRAVAKQMMRQRSGQIINIASISALQGREGQANYAASKAGLIGLTKAAARELGRYGISVNAVLPGYLPTDMGTAVAGPVQDRILKENALGRASDAGEVARFLCHLAAMRNVSGQVFNLDSRIV